MHIGRSELSPLGMGPSDFANMVVRHRCDRCLGGSSAPDTRSRWLASGLQTWSFGVSEGPLAIHDNDRSKSIASMVNRVSTNWTTRSRSRRWFARAEASTRLCLTTDACPMACACASRRDLRPSLPMNAMLVCSKPLEAQSAYGRGGGRPEAVHRKVKRRRQPDL